MTRIEATKARNAFAETINTVAYGKDPTRDPSPRQGVGVSRLRDGGGLLS